VIVILAKARVKGMLELLPQRGSIPRNA